jgi:hypothetical protein
LNGMAISSLYTIISHNFTIQRNIFYWGIK